MMKIIKFLIKTLILIVILWIIMFTIDFIRCENLKKPIFAILKLHTDIARTDDSNDWEYYCLGYRVNFHEKR